MRMSITNINKPISSTRDKYAPSQKTQSQEHTKSVVAKALWHRLHEKQPGGALRGAAVAVVRRDICEYDDVGR